MKVKEQNVPVLRFPGFEGEWLNEALGKVFHIFNGYAFSSADAEDTGALWVKIADVGICEMKMDNMSFLPVEYLSSYKKFVLYKGDFVVALTRPILEGKLKIARISNAFNNSLLNQRVGKLVYDNDLEFVFSMLQQPRLISILKTVLLELILRIFPRPRLKISEYMFHK
jgi:type I restriction enzyme, S subunit